MGPPVPPKYRAFLSYAHADMRWGKWLHAALERFHIDKDLAGRETAVGTVPTSLQPIFRDREDFSGGHTLTDATVTALDQSAALIVLCSAVAAGRPAVNEEVRLFRSRHPQRPVIPVLVDGSYPDNFPPALRFVVTPDGAVTDQPVTILGPDLRESGDGKALGLAKVVAGLTGLGADDIFRRAERAARRARRLRAALAASFVALAMLGGYLYWRTGVQSGLIAARDVVIADKDAREREIRSIVDRELAKRPGATASPDQGQDLAAAVRSLLEQADGGDATAARIAELLRANKIDEAIDLKVAAAEARERRADADRKAAAKEFREAAALSKSVNPARARELYVRAARLDPDDVDGQAQVGWFLLEAGDLTAAEAAYRRVLSSARPGVDDRSLYWARLGIGDIQEVRGDLGGAKATYQEAGSIAERLAKSDPNNAKWQRDLSVSYNKVGNVLVAQGNLSEALQSYRDSLAIRDSLAKADPNKWQRDLSVSYNKVGDVLVAQGNWPEAFKSFGDGLGIADRLAKSDPNNARWQHDLSVSYEKVGDALVGQGNLSEALRSFRDSLAIRDRLAKADPKNATWQRHLSVSYQKVGDVLVAQGNLSEALNSFRDSLAIRDVLAKADAGWQRDLSISYDRVGDVLVAQENLPEALKSFRDSLSIRDRLARADPNNARWQHDLSISYEKIGDVLVAQENLPEALKSFLDSLAIRDRLAKTDPNNGGLQRDLSVNQSRLADVYRRMGEPENALAALKAGKEIIDRIVKLSPDNAVWKRDQAWFDGQIAALTK